MLQKTEGVRLLAVPLFCTVRRTDGSFEKASRFINARSTLSCGVSASQCTVYCGTVYVLMLQGPAFECGRGGVFGDWNRDQALVGLDGMEPGFQSNRSPGFISLRGPT
jgi:hypothetical protein